MVPRILERAGVKEVKTVTAQSFPNEKFTTCPSPDPQKPQTFELAIEEAKREKSDIVILTDPDCDRMGLAVLHKGEYVVLDGNTVAALMTEFVLYSMKPDQEDAAKSRCSQIRGHYAYDRQNCGSFRRRDD